MKADPSSAVVPRWKPVKRGLRRFVALTIFLGCLWLWWAHAASQRLAARVAVIAARGEPLYSADFNPPVDDSQNAAKYYKVAFGAMSAVHRPPSGFYFGAYNAYPPYPPEWHQAADQAMTANAQALALARQASAYQQCYWGPAPAPPAYINGTASGRFFGPIRELADLIADAALYSHIHGDEVESIGRIRDLFHEADAVRNGGGMADQLIANGIETRAYNRLDIIASDLRIDDGALGAGGTPPATRLATSALVRELLDELVDERKPLENRRRMVLAIRAEEFEMAVGMRDQATILKPLLDVEACHVLDNSALNLEAASQPTWPAARAINQWPAPWNANLKSPSIPAPPPPQTRYSRAISASFGEYTGIRVEEQFSALLERRATTIALAARLFRAKYGAWPPSLERLVPEFLPRVPTDPYSAANKPFAYQLLRGVLPDGSDRPMIWCDGPFANNNPPPPEPSFSNFRDGARWRDLLLWTPPSPATSPAGSGN